MSNRVRGVIAPITTPFRLEELSVGDLQENIRKYAKTDLQGFFVLGSNGENRSLTSEEKLVALEAACEAKADYQFLIAGTSCESTRETISLSKQAAAAGADYVCLLSPSYYKKQLRDEAIIRYFVDVADAISIPALLYNAPGFTGASITSPIVESVSRHPNIIGIKDTSLDHYTDYSLFTNDDFVYLSGTIGNLIPAMGLAASGCVLSLADAFPEACCHLCDMLRQAISKQARDLYFRLYRLGNSISGRHGIAGVKYAMDIAGYYGGDPRLPLLPLTDESRQEIRNAIARAGALEVTGRAA